MANRFDECEPIGVSAGSTIGIGALISAETAMGAIGSINSRRLRNPPGVGVATLDKAGSIL